VDDMKSKPLKALSVLWLAAFICLCLAPAGYAVEPLELHIEGVTARGGELLIYCNSNSEQAPRKDDFSVTLGNAVLPVKNVTEFGSADLGASYIFLVDVSGSIKNSQFQGVKDTLTAISGKLRDNDTISVVAIGNETYTQPFVSGSEDIQGQIDAIEPRWENTNLYESVVKSLSILNTHENCNDKKILVIFSDGEEYSFKGITVDEAAIKIEASHIPIYTIAMLGRNPAAQHVETAKILGSFARLSAGGRHYIHTLDKSACEEIADDITASIGKSMIVAADLSDFHSEGNEMDLRLGLTVAGMGKTSGGYAIPTAGLSAPPVEPAAEAPASDPGSQPASPSSDVEPSPNPNENDIPDESEPSYLFWIIIGAVVLALAGLTAFLILRRKKTPPPIAQPEPIPQTAPIRPPVPAPPPGKPRIALRLTKIGLVEEQVYRAEFAGQLVIGRDAAKASLAFKDDDLLSATHCLISYESEGIILRDLGSTNRTFVNGVPIQERYIFENDDILLIGSMELRVNWEPLGDL